MSKLTAATLGGLIFLSPFSLSADDSLEERLSDNPFMSQEVQDLYNHMITDAAKQEDGSYTNAILFTENDFIYMIVSSWQEEYGPSLYVDVYEQDDNEFLVELIDFPFNGYIQFIFNEEGEFIQTDNLWHTITYRLVVDEALERY